MFKNFLLLSFLRKKYKYFCVMTLFPVTIEVINKARLVLWLLLICLRSPGIGAFGSPRCRGFLVNNFVYCAVQYNDYIYNIYNTYSLDKYACNSYKGGV